MPDRPPRRRSRDEAIGAYRDALLRDAPAAELAQIAARLDPETVRLLKLFRAAQREGGAAPPAFVDRLERVLASAPGPTEATSPRTMPLRVGRSHAVNGRRDEQVPPAEASAPRPARRLALPRSRMSGGAFATACLLLAVVLGAMALGSWRRQASMVVAPPSAARFALLWESTGGPEPFVQPSGVAVDPRGNIWVVDSKHDRFQILAPDGTFLESWGESGTEVGQFEFHSTAGNPMYDSGDIAFAPDGTFYVADPGNVRIQQFAPDRSFVRAWGREETLHAPFVMPGAVAVGPDGAVYVSDEDRMDITKFSADGQFLTTIGSYGQQSGQLRAPGGLAVDAAGNVWVADTYNDRVQRFRPDGAVDAIIGADGSGAGELLHPRDVAVDADGRLYVADMGHDDVRVFGADGRFLVSTSSGGNPLANLSYPLAVAVGPDGVVYVVDSQRVRAMRLDLAFGE
jgi:DNA-binding beta-propeller fold protein YncE